MIGVFLCLSASSATLEAVCSVCVASVRTKITVLQFIKEENVTFNVSGDGLYLDAAVNE